MATFTMTVTTGIKKSDKPIESNYVDDGCETSIDIEVIVPSGETRHVSWGTGGDIGVVDNTETISANKTYTLIISRDEDTTQGEEYSFGYLAARISAGASPYYYKRIDRTHGPNIC